MSVDILLDIAKKRPFPLRLDIDTGYIVGIQNTLYSLLDNQLILLMGQLSNS